MSQSSSIEHLKPSDWVRLREAAEKLEEAWREHAELDLASFLPPSDDPLYGSILEELVKTDLEIRRSRGQAVTLDFYLEKYPDLGSERTLPARLIYEEYRVLRRFGEPVDLEYYRQRFPNQFAELQRLVGEQPIDPISETNLTSPSSSEQPPPELGLRGGDTLLVGEGGYHLIKSIGSGSFGEVWEVEAPGGFPAAMKFIWRTLDGEEAKRELRALEVIKRLSHPHLLKTQAAWPSEERLLILMELADCTLRDRLKQCQAAGAVGIPVAELLGYFQEAAEALDYLHNVKVLHRDVKPQNLLLCHGHVKVADFGLAREQRPASVSDSLSGTPGYMSPEAWARTPCAASDQYSLALTYAELRLGRWPFSVDESPVLAHLEGTPDLVRLGEAERSVLLRGLAKNWKERFPTCQALVSALREALPGDPGKYDLRAAPKTRQMPRLDTKNILPAQGGDLASPQTRPIGQFETQGNPKESTSHLLETLVPPQPRLPDDRSPHEDRWVDSEVKAVAKASRKAKTTAKTWQWISLTAVVFLLMAGIAVAVWFNLHRLQPATSPTPPTFPPPPPPPPPPPSFELLAPQPERMTLSAGTGKPLTIQIERKDGFQKTVKVEAWTKKDGRKLGAAEIGPESAEGEVRLEAPADAAAGLYRVDLRVTAEGQREKSASLQVVILPFGFEPVEPPPPNGGELPYPPKIFRPVGNQKVIFVLIRPEGKVKAPFYLMENKISNGMFRVFASERPQEADGWMKKQSDINKDRKVIDDDEPVFGVTRSEASSCASWLRGRLPTPLQWDLAFGYDELNPHHKPFRTQGAAVNRMQLGPRKITDRGDVSHYDIHDLSGNGREWTSEDTTSADGKHLAVLRGRSYTAPEPLTFADLDEWNKNPELCPVQLPNHRSWTTGFRVVLELVGQSGGK